MRVQRCISPIVPLQNLSLLDSGKVQKTQSSSKTEGAQVLQYLERLQNLVPGCPNDRPLSKLELIQSVIDYIYDLEEALEPESDTPSSDSEDDMAVISDSS